MLEDFLYPGMVLELRTPAGHRVEIRRRSSTANGQFYLRERRGGLYVEYRFFERGSGYSQKIYIGRVGGLS